MSTRSESAIVSAEVVLPARDLQGTVDFFVERLGFRVQAIFPADHPRVAVVVGAGLRLRLDAGLEGAPGTVRVACVDPEVVGGGARELVAPNGTRVLLEEARPEIGLPPLVARLSVTHMAEESGWGTGRAGMQYRDLVPDRQGGRWIASHIRIPAGGAVPDYVHYHRVRFQMIFCRAGWVRLVYEDQGPPFVLKAGDCVLQPPEIRHRVLECSPGMEVVEVGSPAEHETYADLELELPTGAVRPERSFGGQRFVRHEVAKATWEPWWMEGLEARDLGIGAATDGVAGAWVARRRGAVPPGLHRHDAEVQFAFVLGGTAVLEVHGHGTELLADGAAFVVPAGTWFRLREPSDDLELLVVTLPAAVRHETREPDSLPLP